MQPLSTAPFVFKVMGIATKTVRRPVSRRDPISLRRSYCDRIRAADADHQKLSGYQRGGAGSLKFWSTSERSFILAETYLLEARPLVGPLAWGWWDRKRERLLRTRSLAIQITSDFGRRSTKGDG